MKTLLIAAAAALALASGAAAARAKTVTVTLTGSHENINDATGVFGPAGGRITDLPFTQTFLINTEVGTFSPPTPTSVSYNSIFGAPGPYAVSGSLTIAGHTFATAGDNYSSAFITPGAGSSPTIYQILSDGLVSGVSPSLSNQIFSLELDGANLPVTLTQALALSGAGDLSATPYVLLTGTGAVTVYDGFIDGLNDASGATLIDSQGSLFPSTITFSIAAAAPEPTTWALLMLAVGGAGLALRRRRAGSGLTSAPAKAG